MSEQKAPDSIEHLDFEVEREQKTSHYAHPIDPELWWCGEKKPTPGIPRSSAVGKDASEVDCVGCLHQLIAYGATWWHQVNRAWYGTGR